MQPRNTLILAFVVAALGAFVWFYEIQGAEQRGEEESASKRVFPGLEADAIEWIELRTDDGQNARLERIEAGWKLVAPLAFPADRFAADGVASTLSELSAEATFDTPEPLENYGLAGEPGVRFGGGEKSWALRIGNTTPVGGNVYMTDADAKKVHAVASWRSNALKKSVKQLRDARVLDFDRAKVSRLAIQSADGRIVLAKGEAGWRLAEPVDAKADTDAVDGLLSDLQYLRADEFVDAPPADAELGLVEPWLRIEVGLEGEAAPLALAVGAERGDKRVVRGSGAPVFEIATSRLDSLPRKLSAYRFKELSRFATDAAASFELRFQPKQGEALSVAGTSDEKGGWTTTPEAMQPGKASRLISELSELRAEDVMADALGEAERAALGLAPPRATLIVRGKPNEGHADGPVLAEVLLGDLDPEHGIPAMRGGEPTVYWLRAGATEQLPISLAAWRESFQAEEANAEPKDESEGEANAPSEPGESGESGSETPAEP
jgi:hypothetical protein